MRKPRHSKRALVAGALASLIYAATAAPPLGDVTLQWSGVAPATNQLFVLRGSPTLSGSPTNWPVLTNVSGMSTTATVRIVPGEFYFMMQHSNIWGLGPPSNVEPLPPLPVPLLLSVQRAQ